MDNYRRAEQNYHMDHAFNVSVKPLARTGQVNSHWRALAPCQNNINAISLLLALCWFALTSELVLLCLEPNMSSVSSARASTNASQGLYKPTSPFPFGGYTDSPTQLRAL
jgi:hypothetical protein